jgi:voltage-gated potassium channel
VSESLTADRQTLSGSPGGLRVTITSFVARHEVAWELAFAALAIVFVAMGLVTIEADQSLVAIEWTITALFGAEFGLRFWAAPVRKTYLRGHLIDLVALVPPVRGLRMLRLLRLLRLIRTFSGVYRAMSHISALANHRGLVWLFAAWAAVMVISSLALFAAENGVNQAIDSPLDALWWGVVTLTTVGYGDVFPVTAEGRLAAAALMLLGIGLFSAITATITSFMLTGRDEPDAADRLRSIVALHADGLLTEEEYRVKRRQIVAEL